MSEINLSKVFTDFRLKGIKINMEELNNLIDSLNNTVNKMQYLIVDKGYVDSLNNDDFTRELIMALSDEFNSEIDLLFSAVDGKIMFSPESIVIARKYTKNEDFIDILDVLYQLFYAIQLLEEIEAIKKYIDSSNILKPDIFYVSNNIKNTNCNFVNRQEFLQILDESNLATIYISGMMYFNFLQTIGIPTKSIIESKVNNKGILMKKLTYKEECDICEYIMKFHIQPDTKFKELYTEEKKKYFNTKVKKADKEVYVYEYLRDIKKILSTIQNDEVEVRLITNYRILFQMNTNKISKQLYDSIGQPQLIKKNIKRIWENSGLYALNWETEEELDKCNALMGYTGEFVTEECIRRMANSDKKLLQLLKAAKPVKLINLGVINNEIKINYINMYRVEDFELAFKVDYKKIVFEYSDINIIMNKFNSTTASELYSNVVKDIEKELKNKKDVYTDYFIYVVADIVLTLLYTDCGLVHTSFVPLNSQIETLYKDKYKLFLEATYIAQEYINSKQLYN